MQELFSALSLWLSAHPLITGWYTAIARLLFPVLSALILVRAIRSLLRIPHTPEVWAQLSLPGGGSIPLTHWENILGRGKSADAILNYHSISRQHAALCRGEDGAWTVYDLGSKGGTAVNGTPVTEQAPVKLGDTITLGGVPLVFLPQTVGEREELEKKRQAERPAAMWPSFLWLTVFQILTAIQLTLAAGEKASPVIPICFLTLTVVMWLYAAALRLGRCVGFELETIAFYLSTLSLAVTASSAPGSLPKQLLAIVLGMGLFLALGLFLRDLERVKKRRWLMAAGAIGLLGITLMLGKAKFGATNWVTLGGISFQPSEIAKICYIFAGSATLERLFRRRNLALFIVLTGVCIGLLGLMSDFGTAAIFFVTFLVIALLAVACILTLAWFAVRASRTGRSSFYTIAACAAGSLLVFQTSLNVFGSVDLLPLTGVTFPFVSNGGSAMLSAWGLLAYLKAMDTRADASFAIGRKAERKLDEEAARMAAPAEDAFEKEDGHAED